MPITVSLSHIKNQMLPLPKLRSSLPATAIFHCHFPHYDYPSCLTYASYTPIPLRAFLFLQDLQLNHLHFSGSCKTTAIISSLSSCLHTRPAALKLPSTLSNLLFPLYILQQDIIISLLCPRLLSFRLILYYHPS